MGLRFNSLTKEPNEESEYQKEQQKQLAEERKILMQQKEEREWALRIKNLTEQYQKSPRVIKAGNDFAEFFIKRVRVLDRDIRVQKLEFQKSLYGNCEYISDGNYSNWIDFKKENLKVLKSKEEVIAILRAIATIAFEYIKIHYPKDDSGSDYTLEAQEDIYESDYSASYSVKFTYTAQNGKYIPPQEW